MDDGDLRATARDARRLHILDVARDVFIEDGFAAASMSTIAARLGGSKGTLYNYFESKEVLFSAVVTNECERKIAAMFDVEGAEDGDMEAVLRGFARRYARMVLSDDAMAFSRMVIAESSRAPELGITFYEAGPRRSRARMAAYLERQIAAGRVTPCDSLRVVKQFCDLCISGLYTKRLMNIVPPPSDEELEANVDAALFVFLKAYGTNERSV
jgi:TetR/AcrR family transcriptional regulator, mexJK operon transcriptional repressor